MGLRYALCLAVLVAAVNVLGFMSPAAAQRAEPQVTVSDAGQEPRRQLRYTPQQGATERVEMSMTMTLAQKVGGFASPPMTTPEIVTIVDVTVDEVTDELMRCTGEYTEVNVLDTPGTQPQVRDMMRQQMQQLVGAKFTVSFTRRGVVREGRFELGDDVDPMLAQMLQGFEQSFDQMSVPLPEEAVRVGAEWTVEAEVTSNGITHDQTTELTLVELEGSQVLLKSSVKMTAGEQDMDLPGVPGNVQAKLLSLESTATGEARLDLERIMPLRAYADSQTDMEMRVESPQFQQQITQDMQMRFEIREAED